MVSVSCWRDSSTSLCVSLAVFLLCSGIFQVFWRQGPYFSSLHCPSPPLPNSHGTCTESCTLDGFLRHVTPRMNERMSYLINEPFRHKFCFSNPDSLLHVQLTKCQRSMSWCQKPACFTVGSLGAAHLRFCSSIRCMHAAVKYWRDSKLLP